MNSAINIVNSKRWANAPCVSTWQLCKWITPQSPSHFGSIIHKCTALWRYLFSSPAALAFKRLCVKNSQIHSIVRQMHENENNSKVHTFFKTKVQCSRKELVSTFREMDIGTEFSPKNFIDQAHMAKALLDMHYDLFTQILDKLPTIYVHIQKEKRTEQDQNEEIKKAIGALVDLEGLPSKMAITLKNYVDAYFLDQRKQQKDRLENTLFAYVQNHLGEPTALSEEKMTQVIDNEYNKIYEESETGFFLQKRDKKVAYGNGLKRVCSNADLGGALQAQLQEKKEAIEACVAEIKRLYFTEESQRSVFDLCAEIEAMKKPLSAKLALLEEQYAFCLNPACEKKALPYFNSLFHGARTEFHQKKTDLLQPLSDKKAEIERQIQALQDIAKKEERDINREKKTCQKQIKMLISQHDHLAALLGKEKRGEVSIESGERNSFTNTLITLKNAAAYVLPLEPAPQKCFNDEEAIARLSKGDKEIIFKAKCDELERLYNTATLFSLHRASLTNLFASTSRRLAFLPLYQELIDTLTPNDKGFFTFSKTLDARVAKKIMSLSNISAPLTELLDGVQPKIFNEEAREQKYTSLVEQIAQVRKQWNAIARELQKRPLPAWPLPSLRSLSEVTQDERLQLIRLRAELVNVYDFSIKLEERNAMRETGCALSQEPDEEVMQKLCKAQEKLPPFSEETAQTIETQLHLLDKQQSLPDGLKTAEGEILPYSITLRGRLDGIAKRACKNFKEQLEEEKRQFMECIVPHLGQIEGIQEKVEEAFNIDTCRLASDAGPRVEALCDSLISTCNEQEKATIQTIKSIYTKEMQEVFPTIAYALGQHGFTHFYDLKEFIEFFYVDSDALNLSKEQRFNNFLEKLLKQHTFSNYKNNITCLKKEIKNDQ